MEKAKDHDDLICRIAEQLQGIDHVYYDEDTLEYAGVFDYCIFEYEDYFDMPDDEIAKIPDDELRDWQRDTVIDLKKTLKLKSSIDNPESYVAFRWMEDFTEAHANNQKFFRDAVKALRNRHPFRGFRSALDWNGLTEEWYPFRDARMEEYVRKNI